MMNKIDGLFNARRADGGKSLVFYLTAGYPDLETTERLIPVMAEAGCDLLELGVPFSDPIADGPTIQKACYDALQAGTSLEKILQMVERLRSQLPELPIILFSAYNPYLRFGLDALVDRCKGLELDGYLAADLPLEESWSFRQRVMEAEQHLIYLTAPTTPADRKKKYARKASGFLYYISLAGVTGARDSVASDIAEQIAPFREENPELPVAVGFGVSKPEHVSQVTQSADAAVIGSALINVITENIPRGQDAIVEGVGDFVRRMAEPLRHSSVTPA
jgi:tryptophan synthase alpha chain